MKTKIKCFRMLHSGSALSAKLKVDPHGPMNSNTIFALVNVNAPVVATTSWWWHFYALVMA